MKVHLTYTNHNLISCEAFINTIGDPHNMPLTILTDREIQALLESLTVDDLLGFRNALASALREHSARRTQTSDNATALEQPERISVHSPATGATTLFMPSCNTAGNAVKGKPPCPTHFT